MSDLYVKFLTKRLVHFVRFIKEKKCSLTLNAVLTQVMFLDALPYPQILIDGGGGIMVKTKAWEPNSASTFCSQPHKQASAQGHNNNSNNKS